MRLVAPDFSSLLSATISPHFLRNPSPQDHTIFSHSLSLSIFLWLCSQSLPFLSSSSPMVEPSLRRLRFSRQMMAAYSSISLDCTANRSGRGGNSERLREPGASRILRRRRRRRSKLFSIRDVAVMPWTMNHTLLLILGGR